jgi:hypothetical protein
MKFLSRLFSAALLLTVVCLNTSPAGESIRGTRSPQKIYPRDLSSIMKLHTLTDQEAALQALNPPKLPPDIGEFPEAEFEKMKDAPKPEFDGHGTLTIDRSGGISGLPSVTGAPTSPLAPIPSVNFEGNIQGGGRPGDLMVATGLSHVVCVANSSIRILTKTGTNVQTVSAQTFFNTFSIGIGFYDPKVAYDVLRNRFIMLWDFEDESPNVSAYYVAVSKTSDPTNGWYIYSFDMTLDGGTPTNNWSDFPGLGFDDNSLYMTGNMYNFPTDSGSFHYVKTRVVDKNAMYNGDPVFYVDILNTPGGGSHFTMKPAFSLSSTSTEYLYVTPSGGGNTFQVYRITGGPSSPVLEQIATLGMALHGAPPDGVQKDCPGTPINSNDCRAQDPVWRNGFLHAVTCGGVTIGGGSVAAIIYNKVNTGDLTMATNEVFGAANTFYMFPAVTVDAAGSAYFSFSRSSATEFASAWFTGKRPSEANIEPSALLKSGNATYWCTQTGQRWGDYHGISIDPSDSGGSKSSAWIDANWSKSNTTWGSWIGKTSFLFHTISGTVVSDCDSSTGTAGDRVPVALATVTLHRDTTTLVGTATTDSLGRYSFGLLDDGTYDVTITPSVQMSGLDAVAGSGGTSETRISATDLRVVLSGASSASQVSTGNNFIVVQAHPLPVATSISPDENSTGEPDFTLTVNGTHFLACSVVRVDGNDRATTYVSPTRLQATILASDIASVGTRIITVFNPAPFGGSSNTLGLTVHAPAPKFSVAPATISFGTHLVGSGSTDSVSVTNNGTADLVVSSADADNAAFTVELSGGTIPRQTSQTFYVHFTPAAPGPVAGHIVFVHNAATSPDSVGVDGAGSDSSRFRTATSLNWAHAVDAKARHKSMPRKPDKVFFKFSVTSPINPALTASLRLSFNIDITSLKLYSSKAKTDTVPLTGPPVVDSKRKVWTFNFPPESLHAHHEIQFEGVGNKGKPVKPAYIWFNQSLTLSQKGKIPDSLSRQDLNHLGLPKPNLNNVGEELFPKGFGQVSSFFSATSPLIVGVPRGLKEASSVKLAKYANVVKSLIDTRSGQVHSSSGRCLNKFDSGDSIKSAQTSLPPTKQNNLLFAEVIALHLNIAASATLKFPVGFGELTFSDPSDPGNPFNNQMVKDIARKADTLLACLPLTSKGPSPALIEVQNVVSKINATFSDSANFADTVSFISKTVLPGTRSLGSVPYLHVTPGIVPLSMPSTGIPGVDIPSGYALYQNYPNPFNPTTEVSFYLARTSLVTLKVYNVLGEQVAGLLDREMMDEGDQEVEFNAGNLPSGVYFYRIVAEGIADDEETGAVPERFMDAKKMLLVR